MKLASLNNTDLGFSRTIGSGYETNVPTSFSKINKVYIDDENTDSEDIDNELSSNNTDIENEIDNLVSVLQMANSWAPFKNVPKSSNLSMSKLK
jgi:hypothetical protein